jgi:Ca2+-binding RTX toxin-like protein
MTATLLLAAPAQAATTVTCTHGSDGATMVIAMNGNSGDPSAVVTVRRDGAFIEVNDAQCGTTAATINNTPLIDIQQQGQIGSHVTLDLRGGPFISGGGVENFIEYRETGNSSLFSQLTVQAPDTGSNIAVGQLGINLNADETNPDFDVITERFTTPTFVIDRRNFVGGTGVDRVTLAGGAGTGAAFPAIGGVDGELRGGGGNDHLTGNPAFRAFGEGGDDTLAASVVEGGAGNDHITGSSAQFSTDFLNGGADNDTVIGLAGPDNITPGTGNDTVFGGTGSDDIDEEFGGGNDRIAPGPGFDSDVIAAGAGIDTYVASDAIQGVQVDLAVGDVTQDTGQGFARINNVEAVEGSPFADLLIGTTGADTLSGRGGDDVLRGRGGADQLNGEDGSDTALFEDATGPVTADLAAGTASSGGTAQLSSLERLIGGPQGDTLLGTDAANEINGAGGADDIDPRAGADVVNAGEGDDTLRLEDGAADTGDCGGGTDLADADAGDQLAGCETVTLPPVVLPPPPPPPPPCVPVTVIPGNGIDENCDNADEPFPVLTSTVRTDFAVFARFTRIRVLVARNVPAGATVEVRCNGRGCPFKRRSRVQKKAATLVNLAKLFKLRGADLKPDAKLHVRVTLPLAIGKTVVFTIRNRKLPTSRNLCLPPGATKGQKCG